MSCFLSVRIFVDRLKYIEKAERGTTKRGRRGNIHFVCLYSFFRIKRKNNTETKKPCKTKRNMKNEHRIGRWIEHFLTNSGNKLFGSLVFHTHATNNDAQKRRKSVQYIFFRITNASSFDPNDRKICNAWVSRGFFFKADRMIFFC